MPDQQPDARPATWEDIIEAEAKKQGVDPRLALSVAKTESSFNPAARSPAGALGLMQLMPETAQRRGVDPNDPIQNIVGGVGELKDLLKQHNGDVVMALRRYNGSPQASPEATQPYVDTVLKNLQGYQSRGQGMQAALAPAQAPSTAPPAPQGLLSPEAAQTVNQGLQAVAGAVDPAIRFGGGAVRETVGGITGMLGAVRHPINTLNAMGENFTQESGQALEEAKKGNYGQAVIHGIAAVPVGSEAVDIGRQAYNGDWAGAAGRVAGALALPKIVGKVPTVARGVARTGALMAENPSLTATGAVIGHHTMGPIGIPVGAVLGAHGIEIPGKMGAMLSIARNLAKGGEKAAEVGSKVAPEVVSGTEVAPVVARTLEQELLGRLQRGGILSDQEWATLENLQRAGSAIGEQFKPAASAAGMRSAAFGRGGGR